MSEGAVRSGSQAVLALDIGGTKLAAGVVERDGAVRGFARCATEAARGPDLVLERLVALARTAVSDSGTATADLLGVGVGCAGPLNTRRGVITNPANLPGWRGFPIVARLSEALGLPVVLHNDAVAAAMGEYHAGAARGAEALVYLTVSTGIGGGVVAAGRPLGWRTGNGGELGHTIVMHGGRRCGCGARGCLEAYASGTAIAAVAAELVGSGVATSLRPDATAADVARAAELGDEIAGRIWAEAMAVLGSGVASMINIFEPDLVVLGGGLTRAGVGLLCPVTAQAHATAYPIEGKDVEIRLAALGEEVGVVGAAMGAFAELA